MGEFKCFGNKVRPRNIQPFRSPKQPVSFILNDLINDIPSVNITLIAPHYRMDMRLDSFQQCHLIHGITVLIFEQPARRLVVPDQGMAPHCHGMFTGEGCQSIGILKGIDSLLWLHIGELHLILSGNAVEMMGKQPFLRLNRQRVHSRSNFKIILENAFQSCLRT
ncbi:hypothetical protein D3C77_468590 [compost metagenome]